MRILVIAEQHQGSPTTTLRPTIRAALALTVPLMVFVAGQQADTAAQAIAQIAGVDTVLYATQVELADQRAEAMASVLLQIVQQHAIAYILAPTTVFARAILPRLAALLDHSGIPVALLTDVVSISAPNQFLCSSHAGNIHSTVQTLSTPVLMTIHHTAFTPLADRHATETSATLVPLVVAAGTPLTTFSRLIRFIGSVRGHRPDLRAARIVVSVGQGVAAAGNFHLVEALADLLGAAIGATRSAVDAGLAPPDWQVGQTGKIIAPEFYIALGISGALQHLAGVKEARYLVAINNDPYAPIHAVADFSLVADLCQAVPQLIAAIKQLDLQRGPST